jgi:hypothetical protein
MPALEQARIRMSDTERHEMLLQQTFPSGVQEWLCTVCQRRVVIEHGASRVKIIALERGNEHAIHSTGSGGLSIAASRARESDDVPEPGGWLH